MSKLSSKNINFLFFLYLSIFKILSLHAQVAPFGTIGFVQSSVGNKGFVMETKYARFTQLRNSLDLSNQFTQTAMELRLVINKAPFAMGNRAYGIRGWSMYPQFSIGGVRRNGIDKKFSGNSWGIVASPGINIALPYLVIEANIQSTYYFKNYAGGRKLFFTPTIGIKLDGLFEVLDVNSTNSGKYGRWETYKTGETKVRRQGYDEITTYYKTKFKIRDYVYYSVANFGGITPRYSWANPSFAGQTKMSGIGYNQRVGIMAIDAIFETGQQGYASHPNKRSYLYNPYPKDNSGVNRDSTAFMAEGKQTRAYLRVGVDLKNLITRFTLGAAQGRTKNPTAAFRVIGGVGVGYASVKNTQYLKSDASEKMEQLFETNPDLWRSGMNDPKLTKSGLMYHAFLAFEFGVVVVELNTNVVRNAPMSAGGLNTSVSYIIPIKKLIQKYKESR